MSENTTETSTQDTGQPEGRDATDGTDHEGVETGTPQSKEARYRIRAREAEKTAARLRDSLTGTRRAMLVDAATRNAHLHPSAAKDLCAGMDDASIDALFDQDGAIDAAAFDKFTSGAVEGKPYLIDNRPKAPGIPGQGKTPRHVNVNHWSSSFGGV